MKRDVGRPVWSTLWLCVTLLGVPFGHSTTLPAKIKIVTILPWEETVKQTSDAVATAQFGAAVAISGDTMVVGAPRMYANAGTNVGVVAVLVRNQTGADSWSEVARLTASNGSPEDGFGSSVAIDGDRIVVGAPAGDNGTVSDCGAAYVFERNHGGADNWGEVAILSVPGLAAFDGFGAAVDISGDTVVVGAPYYDVLSATSSGAAWVFSRNSGGQDHWGWVKLLTYPGYSANDYFGSTVAIDGQVVVVGKRNDSDNGAVSGAAWLYERNQGGADNWGPVKKLTASDAAADEYFGYSVAIDGDTVVISAPMKDATYVDEGAVYILGRNQGGADNWGEVAKLVGSSPYTTGWFGEAVALSKDTLIVGTWITADTYGAVWRFERNGAGADSWAEIERLVASDAAASDAFGAAVAIDGNTVVVGAESNSDVATNAGAAYVLTRSGSGWLEMLEWSPTSVPGGTDMAGSSLSLDDDTVLAGAPETRISTWAGPKQPGVVSIHGRNEGGPDTWGVVTIITSLDGGDGDRFGEAVSVSRDTAVVGAPAHTHGTTASGAAYVFERNALGADAWAEVVELIPAGASADDRFGCAVVIDGDQMLIGAEGADAPASSAGAAFLFERNQGGADMWGEVVKLTAADGAALDGFGHSLDLSHDLAAIGAPFDDWGGLTDPGAVYLFERNAGAVDSWGQVKKITASDGSAEDWFGYVVSLDNDTVAVGASQDDAVGPGAGSVYLFERNRTGADAWGLVKKLLPEGSNQAFGSAVWLNGDRLVVGAHSADQGAAETGMLYVYERNRGGADQWGLVDRIFNPTPGTDDHFGSSVALSGNTLVAGAPQDTANLGSIHVFRAANWEADLAVTIDNGQTSSTPGSTVSYTITLTNAAGDAVTDARLQVEYNPALVDVSGIHWSCTPSGFATCSAEGDADALAVGISADLYVGDSVVVSLDTPVLLSATGALSVTAVIDCLMASDSNLADNSDTDTDTLTAPPGPIFTDGFESGDTSAWSSTAP